MIKLVYCIRRRADGTPEEFHRYWLGEHGPLVRSVAEAIGARASEISFVRGGTESDNLAILGWCGAHVAGGASPRLVISAVEHHAATGRACTLTPSGPPSAQSATSSTSRLGATPGATSSACPSAKLL